MQKVYAEAKSRMEKALEALKSGLAKIRTGRAHPSLIENVMVSYYGQDTPLKQVANIIIEDARTLTVTPWEKTMVNPIDKGIRDAGLGLNPVTAGMVIRVPMPALTEERRKELVKNVRAEAEQGRVSVRNVRRDANQQLKTLLKNKELAEDEERKAQDKIQTLTDDFITQIDSVMHAKEADLLHV